MNYTVITESTLTSEYKRFSICNKFVVENKIIFPWGRFGFDRMIDGNGLRVRALFTVINEQIKLNANNDNIVVADFSRAAALRAA